MVLDGLGPVPWNVFFEQEPVEKAFLSAESLDCWRPFWGIRYDLAGGRRVEPLRRLPWLNEPKVLLVICPTIFESLPAEQKATLDAFVSTGGFKVIGSKAELAAEMEELRPDLMYWLCHATPSALVLNDEEISPGELMDMFRSQADEDRLGGLAFLNACQTAESSEQGSFMDALLEVGLSGVIATEHQTVDTFANPFGLEFLERFIKKDEPIGPLLQDLRSKRVPLGLLYATYCPPQIKILGPEPRTAEREINLAQRLAGVALGGARSSLAELKLGPKPAPLPAEPYRLFAPFDRYGRALFVGREDDVRRFSLILDDSKARIVILHGESGVGKSSFLRAGVIPYLEDECIGYQFLSTQKGSSLEPSCRFLRATNDLVGQIGQLRCEFCTQTYSYPTLGMAPSVAEPIRHRHGANVSDPTSPKAEDLAQVIRPWRKSQPPGLRPQIQALHEFLRAEDGYAESRRALRRLVPEVDDPREDGGLNDDGPDGDDDGEDGSTEMAHVDLAGIATEVLGCELRPEPVCAVLRADPARFGKLLKEITRRLPHALILVIDQAEEIFTLARDPKDTENGQLAIELLRKAMAESGNFKIIVSLRTEYYGRFIDGLRTGVRDVVGVREYMLTDFGAKSLVQAIRLPTSTEPIPGATEIPFEKYRFSYTDGLAERIAHEVLIHNAKSQDSVLPLVQVICSQLYEIVRHRTEKVIRPEDLDAIGSVRGGMQRHIDRLIARLVCEFPTDLRPLKRLMTRLYLRQSDGGLTTALIPLDDLAAHWSVRQRFDTLIRSAVEMKLLKINTLTMDEIADRSFVSLGHDALAKVASVWEEELLRGARFRRLAAMTMGSMALAGGLAVLACWAVVERARADKARQRAVAAKNEAMDYLGQSMDTLDQSFIKISEIDLVDVPGMVRTRERLLSDADRGYHELLDKYRAGAGTNFGAADLKIRWGMGRAFRSLGDIERQLGDLVHSYNHLKKAIELLESLLEGAPAERNSRRDLRRDLARAYHGKGETLRLRGDYVGSEADFDKAIALREGSLDDPEDIRSLAASHHSRAALLAQFPPRYAEAEGEYRRAIELIAGRQIESNVAENPVGENLLLLARYKVNLARLKQQDPRLLDQAKVLHEQVLEILDRQLPEAFRKQPGVRWQRARCRNNMGKILYNQSSQKDAEQSARDALSLIYLAGSDLDELVVEFPEVPQYRRELASACENLGEIKVNEALKMLRKLPEIAPGEQELRLRKVFQALDDSRSDFKQVIGMIDGITGSASRLRDDDLNRASASFDMHRAEAWTHLLREIDRGLRQVNLSHELALIDSDLKSLEKAIEPTEGGDPERTPHGEQPRIAWHHRKLASKHYSLYRFLYDNIANDRIPPEDRNSWIEKARRALEVAIRHSNLAGDHQSEQRYKQELSRLGYHVAG